MSLYLLRKLEARVEKISCNIQRLFTRVAALEAGGGGGGPFVNTMLDTTPGYTKTALRAANVPDDTDIISYTDGTAPNIIAVRNRTDTTTADNDSTIIVDAGGARWYVMSYLDWMKGVQRYNASTFP